MKRKQHFVVCSTLFLLTLTPLATLYGQGPSNTIKKASSPALKASQVFVQREQKASPQIKTTLTQLRSQVVERKLNFSVGYTEALDKKLEMLAGTRAPDNLPSLAEKQNTIASEMIKVDSSARDEYLRVHPNALPELKYWQIVAPCTALKAFDWRKSGKVTPVRNQGGCGSCWAFGAMGAFEGSYLIRNNAALDTSEQHVLNCSGSGSCGGGWHAGVFDWMIRNGNGAEVSDPYTATDHACKAGVSTPYRAVAWGYVKSDGGIPSVAEMKAALCQHGPLTVAVYATPLFQAYTGGVFDEKDTSHGINHDITLIGWDDSKHAWLIKNSWGTYWGETGGFGTERGYMWIDYDSNNIGYGSAWVQPQNRFYILPSRFLQLMPDIKPLPGPMKRIPIQQTPIPHAPSGF